MLTFPHMDARTILGGYAVLVRIAMIDLRVGLGRPAALPVESG